MKFDPSRYKYYSYTNSNGVKEIAAVSSYAGRTVRGTAKCNPNDGFSEEKGKALAAARCNEKVARKRKARATERYLYAVKWFNEAKRYLEKCGAYYTDACDQLDEATEGVRFTLEDM